MSSEVTATAALIVALLASVSGFVLYIRFERLREEVRDIRWKLNGAREDTANLNLTTPLYLLETIAELKRRIEALEKRDEQ